jgi:hypothetical protein
MRIDLRSAATQVAVLDTAVIFVVRTPEVPLLLSTTIELTAPPAFDPTDVWSTPRSRRRSPDGLALSAGGGARQAGERHAGQPHRSGDPASLLDQLARMADGYERADGTTVEADADGAARAAAVLTELRHAVSSALVHVSAMPFSAPTIPSLIASGSPRLAASRPPGATW